MKKSIFSILIATCAHFVFAQDAIDFSFVNPKGKKTLLSSLQGKVVILNFWGTWCAPCIKEIPKLNALVDKYKEEPVEFLAITTEDEEKVFNFFKNKDVIFKFQQITNEQELINKYSNFESEQWNNDALKQIVTVPLHVIIDKKGKVIFYHKGSLEKTLRDNETSNFNSNIIDEYIVKALDR